MNSSVDKKKELGLWLKLLLTKHGLRQNKLAAELGVTCQYVSQICVGKTSLPLNHFDRIHKLLLSQGASDDDLKKLSYLYVDSRVSLPDSMQISNDDYYHLLQELKGYVEKERVINACLETAVGTRNYDDAMQAILNTISTYAARQYCYIYRYEPAAVRLMYSWHAPDVPPVKGFELIDLPTPTLWDKTLEAHELINIYDPGETQLVPRDIAELFRRNNFRAVLGTGLWADGRLYGFIILASLKQIRRFSELEERVVLSAARVIQLLTERQTAAERQERAQAETDALLHGMPFPAFRFGGTGELVSLNTAGEQLLGSSAAELCGRDVADLFGVAPDSPFPVTLDLNGKSCSLTAVRQGEHTFYFCAPATA